MSQSKATKELRIVTRHVVTLDSVKKDLRKLKLLYIIQRLGKVSEKGLTHLIYRMMNDKNLDLGYRFFIIANTPNSKELLEDLRVLLYLGLVEVDPITHKLRLTTLGNEFLGNEVSKIPEKDIKDIDSAIEELKSYVQSLDSTTEIMIRGLRALRGRRRPRR